MIKQLAHLCIHSSDFAATERFYFKALGLERGFTFEKEGQLFGFYIQLGNQTFIEVFQGESGQPGNINHLALEVDDIDAVIASLREHDFEVGEKSLGPDHSWQAWTNDPNGVRIEFHQYTDRSMQVHGGVCPVNW